MLHKHQNRNVVTYNLNLNDNNYEQQCKIFFKLFAMIVLIKILEKMKPAQNFHGFNES